MHCRWLCLCCVFLLFPPCFGQPLFGLASNRGSNGADPCVGECECRDGEREQSFVVNCTGPKFGLFQGMNIPRNLPLNTTDLIVSEYLLGTLSIDSFPNYGFPLNPMFLSVSLRNCHITHLSSETFQGNSFVTTRNITLTHNSFDLLVQGTFKLLPKVENIKMDGNFLRRVQKEAFYNLPQVYMVNLSHNAIEEIQQGSFDNLPKLEVLDLSHNWLKTIPGRDIAQLTSLKHLSLIGNFWNCSCEMSWITNFTSILVDSGEAVCLYPKILNGTPLQQLTVKDFQHCSSNDLSFQLNSVIILTILIGLLVMFLLRCVQQSRHSDKRTVGNNVKQALGSNHEPNVSHHSDIRTVGRIEFNVKKTLGSNRIPNVFEGKLQDGRLAAVKIYPSLSNIKELDILLHLSEKGSPHKNVIQYLCVEKDSMNTYIALELCGGNLKTAIFDHKEEFLPFLTCKCCLYQIAQGIKFLHDLNVQHRDIKPQNILWRRSGINSKEIRFIVSDFDLSHFTDEETSHKAMRGTEGWSAPELWNSKGQRTTAVDIFSLGCVFYYVLTNGRHPFGLLSDRKDRQKNIDENKFSFSDLKECHDDFLIALAEDLIRQMVNLIASKRPNACNILEHPLFVHQLHHSDIRTVGKIEFNVKKSLGSNRIPNVFEGKLQDGRLAAVKIYPLLSNIKELDILLHLSEEDSPHKNVIQYLCVEKDSMNTYIALELCGGNLKTAIFDHKEEFLPFLTCKCCLYQIAQGIKFLHDLNVQHRDIKPQNILWRRSGINSKEIRFIVSDFDLSHFTDEETSHKAMRGTEGWSAPELWNSKGQRTTAVDIFSLGCVFYYVLTNGRHPFGLLSDREDRQKNIDGNKFSFSDLKECHDDFLIALAEDLIGQMVNLTASKRPNACNILEHPLFWDCSDMEKFYRHIGVLMRDKLKNSKNQQLKENLECDATAVFQRSWKERLHMPVRKSLRSFSSEQDKICILLKVVRNQIDHFLDLHENVRSIYEKNGGVIQYYNNFFPKLLIYTFRVEQEWKQSTTTSEPTHSEDQRNRDLIAQDD